MHSCDVHTYLSMSWPNQFLSQLDISLYGYFLTRKPLLKVWPIYYIIRINILAGEIYIYISFKKILPTLLNKIHFTLLYSRNNAIILCDLSMSGVRMSQKAAGASGPTWHLPLPSDEHHRRHNDCEVLVNINRNEGR